ncbi:MAG: FixH family protein [Hyphomonadaceae bacterium]|nr:MAG: FixH family protein [Hyphomonadaceae bacterium]KAF0183835.1 MAG: FixH family protein [Hyphomonadaceae bacterium]
MTQIEAVTQKSATKGELKGWHVLLIILGMFGVVFAVNGYMIYKAITTLSGEEPHAYMEGLKFNETLSARAAQSQAGWTMKLDMRRGAGGDVQFIANLKDKAGKAVHGANMQGQVGRPADDKHDMALNFAESEAGTYVARLPELGPGKWDFRASANLVGAPQFVTETSLSIR